MLHVLVGAYRAYMWTLLYIRGPTYDIDLSLGVHVVHSASRLFICSCDH